MNSSLRNRIIYILDFVRLSPTLLAKEFNYVVV